MTRLYIVTLFISLICEILGWMNHKLESRLPGEISTTRYADDTTLMLKNKEELKSLFRL